MPQFYPLEVTSIQADTRDAVIVSLSPQDNDAEHFSYQHGQYLTFRKRFEDVELRRSYSICSSRKDAALRVGIKRVDDGVFSSWANSDLKVGDVLETMPPAGHFNTVVEPQTGKNYLAFAVGSGITPIYSVLKTLLEEEPSSKCTLVLGNRSINSLMFREMLEDLKNQYLTRLSLVNILKNDGGDIDLFNGRIDQARCEQLFEKWVDVSQADTAFICGPESMMLAVSQALVDHGMDKTNIRFELFASSQPGRVKRKKTASTKASTDETKEVSIVIDGISRTIKINDDTSVLDAALEHSIDAPYACKAGVCSTCRCKILEGEAEMTANHALEDYEVAQGYILSCQAHPMTKKLVVDFDQ